MFKFFAPAVAGMCGTAFAQTPASNPMPDGSRDMYIGLGVQAVPRHAAAMRQVAWSVGLCRFRMGLAERCPALPSVKASQPVGGKLHVSASWALPYR
ncbi:hypothetical protein [Pseudoduganella chitinolytica]|uniref:Uncharacterized protein n=1 Tax=Pseudoduganella chitinolytica TaxID=34070 RepID=A0ABY8B840_9BURK|nr:hypothetical protein [Pseudoduganella chitinolytica]WEF32101.1 hypothetical protein PX653_22175 [Pseudoduganella chitinolytica]